MKKITYFKLLLLTVVLLLGEGNVFGQTTLPFSYDLGKPSGVTGLTHSGLGSDYSSSPKMKFDTSGDNLILFFSDIPGTLSFNIKWNQSSSATRFPGEFTLLESSNGTDYTTVQLYNSTNGTALPNGTVKTETFSTLLSTTRYLKWEYTNKSNGNIAIGAINLTVGTSSSSVIAPTVSVSGVERTTDTYYNTADVTLSSSTEGASVFYTTNGDDPTSSSTLYTAPFTVTTTTTVKAIATKADMDDSSIAEKTITIVTPATATVPYTEAFNNTLGDWSTYEVAGAKPWYATADGVYGNGYSGGDVESWLISPKFTATADGLALSFNYASKYTGNPLLVKVSSDYIGYGSPAAATWTDLSSVAAPDVQDNSYTVKNSGNMIVTSEGTVYFALVYDNDTNPYSDWRITNASVDVPLSSPSITVVQLNVPEMTAEIGSTDTETLTVSGANLTGNISLALTGDDAALFDVSPSLISPTDGSVSDVTVTITYTPVAAGSHTATLTLSSADATDVVRELTASATWPPLSAPVATAATGISTTAFTANWDAVSGATGYEVSVYTKEEGSVAASDLFISEYVEGSGNNKVIELYNGTGVSVDLSAYSLKKQANGTGDYASELTLSGSLASGEAYVIAYSSASTTVIDLADLTSSSQALTFNGNDAVALFKNGTQIDEVGVFDQVANWGADVTLIRKSTISGPKATYDAADWDSYAQDYFSDLGSHTFDGAGSGPVQIAGSPFTVTGENSKQVTGLTNNTTYYYTVVAYNDNVTSEASSEIMVVTSISTGVDNPVISNIYVSGSSINFSAKAGELVEVYNAVGQKLVRTMATDGLNSVQLSAKGVMMVKVGDKIAKVIL